MDLPDRPHLIRDPKTGVIYRVMAYRDLTRAEAVAAVRHYKSSPEGRKRKPKRGETIEIISIIGHDQ